MSYYRILGLEKEPFSTSPDPEFFFLSREHKAAFFRLQVAIRLRRGLSVILGDVGTGKTTLSRKLAQVLAEEPNVDFHMILNPCFKKGNHFLSRLVRLFRANAPAHAAGPDMIEAIERALFRRGVEHGRTIVLLVDEAQILPKFVLEALRILLNYETNEYKILQVVLVGQMELLPRIRGMANFWDRISLKYVINPFGENEVAQAIEYRLKQAGYRGEIPLFSQGAIKLITEHTQGYPRKVSLLCHNALETLVMRDKRIVDEKIIRSLIESDLQPVT
ncbi:MAG: AAA family ATPase [Verrucomicrobiota bacterium]|nr:AAA family ATPase [Verrucomicrobiota bacterium]